MTTALLHRSRAFVRLAGVTVDILTFDARDDYPDVERRLRERGELIPGTRLLNLYEWLRDNPLPGGSLQLDRHPFDPLERTGTGLTEVRRDRDGTILQVDHYRRDGSLLLSDRRDVRTRGTAGGRAVVLCDDDGTPVRSWGGIHPLYRAWLDSLTGRTRSFMIVDSKTIAPFMLGYQRRRVVTVHVVHNSHRGDDGGFRTSRREVLTNARRFDSVVLLTERQRRDLAELIGSSRRLAVIPSAAPEIASVSTQRDPRRGVVLASLTRRKRVGHAIRAVIAASAAADVRLDIYGDGELREPLEKLAASAPAVVRMHGHRPDARTELGSASFVLATGSSEGLPMVIIEAMAAGCIPIAYDVPYGPSDLIDGVNGILVPSGDVDALAAAVTQLMAESPEQLERRRRHARRTAEAFTDEAITARWGTELRAASHRHDRGFVVRVARAGARVLRPAA
jgi:poly(glycerol-phosphate) alpha-glucosyltransferase